MRVEFQGKEYTLDIDEIDVAQSRHIYRKTGLSLLKLEEGLAEVNPDALVALYWLMLAQSGETVDMDKVNFPVVKFANALIEANKRENPTPEPDEDGQATTHD